MEENYSDKREILAPEENSSWFEGFLDIFWQPSAIALRPLKNSVVKIFSCAALLFALGATFQAYIYSSSPGIREETYRMAAKPLEIMAKSQKLSQQKLDELKQNAKDSLEFSLVKTLGASLLFGAFFILVATLVFWALAFFVRKGPVDFTIILSIISYGTAITFVGFIVTGLMQYLGNSLHVAPNLGWLSPLDENPYLFSFLSRISVFMIWEYVADGRAISSSLGLSKGKGLVISTIVFMIVTLSYGVISFLPTLFIR